jgi:hypothetical protein
MLGISLHSYLHLKLAKTLCLFYYCYVFFSTELEKRAEQVLPGSEGYVGRKRVVDSGEIAQTMYAHMNK